MAVLTYTAQDRGFLVSGHTALTIYNIEFCVEMYDQRMNNVNNSNKSINGNRETLYQRTEMYINLTATFLTEAVTLEMREFISSVGGGEQFFVDPLGTIALPSTEVFPVSYLESSNLNIARSTTPGINARFNIALDIQVV